MKQSRFNFSQIADIGDYLKVFACTAVMSQPIMTMIMNTGQNNHMQDIFGVLYDIVKYTAPAFIFGILYTTIRIHDQKSNFSYLEHLKINWSNLFVPTIWWTLIYLLLMPNLQQVNHYHNISTFLWQFVNGNAAPHLWYNSMMLQFIILMPIFWAISRYVNHNGKRGALIAIATFILYFAWLAFYDHYVFHGVHMHDWYLLDRIFISFFIYAIFGVLAWMFREKYNHIVSRYWYLFLIFLLTCLFWTDYELESFGHPVNFNNAPYYKPSMTFYCLAVIALVSALYLYHIKKNRIRTLSVFHFLATYAYRAYLSNVFWNQVLWNGLRLNQFSSTHPLICLGLMWIETWILSFISAYFLHILWFTLKEKVITSK